MRAVTKQATVIVFDPAGTILGVIEVPEPTPILLGDGRLP